jgi:hypothetical protein
VSQPRTQEQLVGDINRFQAIQDRAQQIVADFKDQDLQNCAKAFEDHYAHASFEQADAPFVLHCLSRLDPNELMHVATIVMNAAKDSENVSINTLAVLDLIASNATAMGSN